MRTAERRTLGSTPNRSASGTAVVLAMSLAFVGVAKAADEQRTWTAGQVFRDCEACPEMVVAPAGSFVMGSPSSEEGRDDTEGPQHEVTIREPFAVGVYEVTRGEFARFVFASGRSTGDSCWTYEAVDPRDRYVDKGWWFDEWAERYGRNWSNPGYGQTDGHPVVCVSWEDAKAYVGWLSRETDKEYRLLSEAEWEYAARGGTVTSRYWEEGEGGQCRHANGPDREVKDAYGKLYDFIGWEAVSCSDGHVHTAPVGSYEANGFGLHDVLGNVLELVEDCWNGGYRRAPSDGSAWVSGDCRGRPSRGGFFGADPRTLRSAVRIGPFGPVAPKVRIFYLGFRVARTLAP